MYGIAFKILQNTKISILYLKKINSKFCIKFLKSRLKEKKNKNLTFSIIN